ncbi:MAG: hypothetical protein HY035_04285 [Nitrospirae bacterium]|nr:hypothetical protein [Nitrospirota bacterium]MBI3377607.1 hypothetical protein [Nitrospirota bacterium]
MGKNPEKTSVTMDDIKPLCPVCGRELDKAKAADRSGWNCKCGEFIPERLIINPFEGCTHGLNCNCGRERRK